MSNQKLGNIQLGQYKLAIRTWVINKIIALSRGKFKPALIRSNKVVSKLYVKMLDLNKAMHGLLKFVAINTLSYLVLIQFLNPKLHKYTFTHGSRPAHSTTITTKHTLIDVKDQSSIKQVLKKMDRQE